MRRLVLALLVLLLASPAASDYGSSSSSASVRGPGMAIPAKIYCAVGRECYVSNTQLCLSSGSLRNTAPFGFTFESNYGSFHYKGWRYTPSTEADTPLIIRALDGNLNSLESVTTTVDVVSKTAGSGTKNLLIIGDSLINSTGVLVSTLYNQFTTDAGGQLTFLGTSGTGNYQHEGYDGWTHEDFATSNGGSNPFWDGTEVNFQWYMSEEGFVGDIDYCVIQLGINDMWSDIGNADVTDAQLSAIGANLNVILDAMLDADVGYPGCQIIISLEPIGAGDLTAIYTMYTASQGKHWWRYERNMMKWWRYVILNYDLDAFDARVSVCAANLGVDRDIMYGFDDTPDKRISSRSLAYDQQWWHTDYLHPYSFGYHAMSDNLYGHLRHLMVGN